MLEMLVFLIGVYTLVFGRVNLPWNLTLHGWRARVASLFLIAPFPILIFLGRVIGRGLTLEQGASFFGISELVVVLLGVGGAIAFAYITRDKKQREFDPSIRPD
jgi:hypothetical protein